MKAFAAIFSLLVSFQVFAGEVVFNENNSIPADLQKKIKSTLLKNCGKAFELGNIIWETKTTVVRDVISRDVVDQYYTSEFLISVKDDPFHFESFNIVVESVMAAATSALPEAHGNIISIKSDENVCRDVK